MDMAALQVFLVVAETGSFTRAAERVFLTQAAVSKRIARLEHDLGTRLFDRIGRRTQLTAPGRVLQARARAILDEIEDLRRGITNLSGKVVGVLSFATSHHVGLHRLPAALKHFYESYPEVQLDLHFMDSEAACAAVAHGGLELAVVTLPPDPPPQLNLTKVWDDPLDIVVSPLHALAVARRPDARALLEYPAILPGPGTYTREIILQAFGNLRTEIKTGMTTNYLEVLRMLASIGLGWSALPRSMIDAELKVVQIKNLRIRRELGIVTHAARTLSNAGQALLRIIRENH